MEIGKSFDEIVNIVKGHCAHGVGVVDEGMMPRGMRIDAADLQAVCANLKDHPSVFFDMLSCLTVIDNGPDAGNLDLVYNLYSIPFNHHFALKITLPRDKAEIDSVQEIWKTANWHEREAFDMFGVVFRGHPDLRRILLPADWEGHPLRKDYKRQEYYRGVRVD